MALLALVLRAARGTTRGGWPTLGLLLAIGVAGTWRYVTSPMSPGSPEAMIRDKIVNPVAQKFQDWRDGTPTPPPATVETSAPPAEPSTRQPIAPEQPPVRIQTPAATEPSPQLSPESSAAPATLPNGKRKGPSVLFPELE